MTLLHPPHTRPTFSSRVGRKALVAVVEIEQPELALPLAQTMGDAGVNALEITLRTPRAIEAIEQAAQQDSITVGAGTVLTAEQATTSIAAGASFVVSPGFSPALGTHMAKTSIPFLPGVATPTEVQSALDQGFSEVKLFPAELSGGLRFINTLAAVFQDVTFVPSGGIRHEQAAEYLRHPRVAAICGTWIAPPALIQASEWEEIERRASLAVQTIAEIP